MKLPVAQPVRKFAEFHYALPCSQPQDCFLSQISLCTATGQSHELHFHIHSHNNVSWVTFPYSEPQDFLLSHISLFAATGFFPISMFTATGLPLESHSPLHSHMTVSWITFPCSQPQECLLIHISLFTATGLTPETQFYIHSHMTVSWVTIPYSQPQDCLLNHNSILTATGLSHESHFHVHSHRTLSWFTIPSSQPQESHRANTHLHGPFKANISITFISIYMSSDPC
jgi:hypothetical protein